jgi:hypothetical protein
VTNGRQVGTPQILTWCFMFVLGFPSVAASCSYSSKPIKIGRNFSVEVNYETKPLAGLQIELSTDPRGNEESRQISKIMTNENGRSEFTNVKPGSYYISINHAAFPQSIEIVVNNRRTDTKAEKITLEWPGRQPLLVQSVSGLINAPIRTGEPLNDQAHPVFGALSGAKLTITRAVSGEVIGSEVASESGAFEFQWIPSGLYMLHVEMAENEKGRYHSEDGFVPVEIDPSAKDSTLSLFLYPGVCGELGYENRHETATQ